MASADDALTPKLLGFGAKWASEKVEGNLFLRPLGAPAKPSTNLLLVQGFAELKQEEI